MSVIDACTQDCANFTLGAALGETVVMAPVPGLERGGSFSKARALRNPSERFELVCMSRQWIHNP